MLAPLPTAHPRVSPEQLEARGYFLMGTDPQAPALGGLTPLWGPAADSSLYL